MASPITEEIDKFIVYIADYYSQHNPYILHAVLAKAKYESTENEWNEQMIVNTPIKADVSPEELTQIDQLNNYIEQKGKEIAEKYNIGGSFNIFDSFFRHERIIHMDISFKENQLPGDGLPTKPNYELYRQRPRTSGESSGKSKRNLEDTFNDLNDAKNDAKKIKMSEYLSALHLGLNPDSRSERGLKKNRKQRQRSRRRQKSSRRQNTNRSSKRGRSKRRQSKSKVY